MTTTIPAAPTSPDKLAQNAEKAKGGPETYDADAHTAEPKLDGWRLLVNVTDEGTKLYSRAGKPYTGCLPDIEAELAEQLPAGTWLDCEAVGLTVKDGKIVHEWGIVQSALGGGVAKAKALQDKISLMAFDLIAHGGIDARALPYAKRRALLEQLFAQTHFNRVLLVPQVKPTDASLKALLDQGYEGMMIKRLDAPYASDKRGAGWTKVKPQDTIDVIVTGFKDGENGFAGMIGAVTFGAYNADGELIELGRCSGMNMKVREDMTKNPDNWIGTVVEIKHMGKMPTGGYRHPQFARQREDKAPTECTVELT